MNNVEKRIDTFDTEELVYNAKMSYGDMDKMLEYIEMIGEQLIAIDTSFQSFYNAVKDNVSGDELDKINNLANEYMVAYTSRFTTEEMREKLVKEGFGDLDVVLVDADWAEDAMDNGREVYALKAEEMFLLDKAGEATECAENGYLLAVSPFDYEAEFLDDIEE